MRNTLNPTRSPVARSPCCARVRVLEPDRRRHDLLRDVRRSRRRRQPQRGTAPSTSRATTLRCSRIRRRAASATSLTIRLVETHQRVEELEHLDREEDEDRSAGPDDLRPPGHLNGTPIFETSVNEQADFDGEGDSAPEQPARRRRHGHRRGAPAERQPAGARPEVDHDQPGRGVHPHPGHHPPDRHRARQLDRLHKVADATISYGGKGALADANTPGWLARFFNSPLLPF